jgi:hypothetical protein
MIILSRRGPEGTSPLAATISGNAQEDESEVTVFRKSKVNEFMRHWHAMKGS